MVKLKTSNEVLKNYIEDIVMDSIDRVMKNMDVCTCDRCRMDTAAIALNHITPKYILTRKGHLYTKISALHQQFDVDVISEISKAAVIVSKKPRHGDTEDEVDNSEREAAASNQENRQSR